MQRVKIKFDFDKKIKPVKALRGVGREKTVKLPCREGIFALGGAGGAITKIADRG